MKIRKIIATALASATLLGTAVTTVSAAPHSSFSYYFKKDNYRNKPRNVILTKNIKIRKIVWEKNNVQHHLGKKKTLKKGSKVKVLANDPKYYWAFFGKYKNWVYPSSKTNWFMVPKKVKSKQTNSKFDLELKNGTYFIKNQGELNLSSATANGSQIVIFGSFKNTSNSEVNVVDLINQNLKITVSGSDQALKLSKSDTKIGSSQIKKFSVTATVDHPEVIETGKTLTIVSNVPKSNTKVVYLPYKK